MGNSQLTDDERSKKKTRNNVSAFVRFIVLLADLLKLTASIKKT